MPRYLVTSHRVEYSTRKVALDAPDEEQAIQLARYDSVDNAQARFDLVQDDEIFDSAEEYDVCLVTEPHTPTPVTVDDTTYCSTCRRPVRWTGKLDRHGFCIKTGDWVHEPTPNPVR